jgi:hypothetical protein
MGAAGSTARGAISDPFPVGPALSQNLDKLSLIAARLLSSPDLYDVNNLVRPELCGDYAVFLRKTLEKKLLPFVTKVDGVRTEVVYANPKKAIADQAAKKAICSSLATTMVRLVFTVVASLASIQVVGAGQSRAATVASAVKQSGGAMDDVRKWLVANEYIAPEAVRLIGEPMRLSLKGPLAAKGIQFMLRLTKTEGVITDGHVTGVGTKDEVMPVGELRIQFGNPIPIPTVAPGAATPRTLLPVRVMDTTGTPWLAGVLYENVFKSFAEGTDHYYLPEILEILLRRTQGYPVDMPEGRSAIDRASELFSQYRRSANPQVVLQGVSRFLQEYVTGYQPGAAAAAGAGAAYPGYPGAAAAGPYGIVPPAAYVPPKALEPMPTAAAASRGAYGAFDGLVRPAAGPGAPVPPTYDIPFGTGSMIRQTLNNYATLIATESSPAAVRARRLAMKENPDRSVTVGICDDPFWSLGDLNKIHAWNTLQYLCVENWGSLSAADRATWKFSADWADFLRGLQSAYTPIGVSLERPENATFLDKMRIKGVADIPVCKTGGPSPRVRYQEIQEGLGVQQALYQRHVTAIWALLNDLIYVIEDPETKATAVRLHPKVLQFDSAEAYVADKSAAARALIAKFYVDVEAAYAATIATMKVL